MSTQTEINVEDYVALAIRCTIRYGNCPPDTRPSDTEEFSDAMLGLTNAVREWSAARGPFVRYAACCIRNSILDGRKFRNRDKRFAIPYGNHGALEPAYTDTAPAHIDALDTLSTVPHPHRKLLHALFFEGKSVIDIAKACGRSRERINQLRRAALAAYKQHVYNRDGWYMVMVITDRQVVYHGTSLGLAAAALEPGTCFGKGASRMDAYGNCTSNRRHLNYMMRIVPQYR